MNLYLYHLTSTVYWLLPLGCRYWDVAMWAKKQMPREGKEREQGTGSCQTLVQIWKSFCYLNKETQDQPGLLRSPVLAEMAEWLDHGLISHWLWLRLWPQFKAGVLDGEGENGSWPYFSMLGKSSLFNIPLSSQSSPLFHSQLWLRKWARKDQEESNKTGCILPANIV
jgi:hypothetical protein